MLPKRNRVTKKEVELIFKLGEFIVSQYFTFKFILTLDPKPPRISFIAPKSIAKLAVKRNMLRRRGYNVLNKYLTQFPAGVTGVFVFKNKEIDARTIENEIKNILNKIN